MSEGFDLKKDFEIIFQQRASEAKKKKVHIPPFLSHLKVNNNGYPIPFFVAYRDGKADFRLLDPKKQILCALHKKCAICGLKLFKGTYYFISGPQGYENKISTDPAMHRQCAEYSLTTCPHLHLQKSHRRANGIEDLAAQQSWHVDEKPPTILLVKCDKFELITNPVSPEHKLIKFRPLSYEIWVYENGMLVKSLMPH